MDSGHFGEGSIRLDWTGVGGWPGLVPQLLIKGKLVARGYGVGAVVQVWAEVTAWSTDGVFAFLGATAQRPYVLNYVKQSYSQPNPPPEDETSSDVELKLPMLPSVIEGLEAHRQGKNLSLQLDVTILLIDGGEPTGSRTRTYYATHPIRVSEERIRITQADWATVLQSWGRGVGILVLVPIAATEPNADRAEVVRHLSAARQKIDGGDYPGSFTESRLALELLRKLSPAKQPLPKDPKERDPLQRVHAIVEALYSLGSAPLHTDAPIKDFSPMRADAIALVAGAASAAQQVFAWLDR